MPIGTVVRADLRFDISGTSEPSASSLKISDVSGAFSWNDGVDRTYTVTRGRWASRSSGGVLGLSFQGSGVVGGDLSITELGLNFLTGADLLQSGRLYADLIAASTSASLQLSGWSSNSGGFSSPVSAQSPIVQRPVDAAAVPEPGSVALFGIALAGIGALRRRRV